MIKLTIDGQSVTVPKGTSVLGAAKAAGIRIPTLCYMEKYNEIGACRLCLVEVKGMLAYYQLVMVWRYTPTLLRCGKHGVLTWS